MRDRRDLEIVIAERPLDVVARSRSLAHAENAYISEKRPVKPEEVAKVG